MGRGRKPKPTALKMLQGVPGRRKLNLEEPDFGAGTPPKPDWFDGFASAEWDVLTAILVPARVLTKGEIGVLVVAVDAYSQLRQCETFLRGKGSLSYDASSTHGGTNYRPYPEVAQRNMARRQYLSALAELGLTPSSRTKVRIITETKPTGLRRLLG
jgi:P27 family predicted phage terminase small subunit